MRGGNLSDRYICVIVTAAAQPQASALAAQLGQPGMFVSPLSADGSQPPTHYISAGYISPQFWDALQSPEAMLATFQANGLPVTAEEVAALFAGADVTIDDPPQVAMARLGLVNAYPPLA